MTTTMPSATDSPPQHERTEPDVSLASAGHVAETVVFTAAVVVVLAIGPVALVWWVVQAWSRANVLVLDVVSAVTIATSMGAWIRLLRPEALIRRCVLVPVAVQRSARNIFEHSAFGVGRLKGWTRVEPDHGLSLVRRAEPQPDGPPSERSVTRFCEQHARRQPVEASSARTARPERPASAVTFEHRTIEHVVARGESFWSHAEQRLGDGRRWTEIRDLNIGRRVAPGVVLSERDAPQVGHRILVPDAAPSSDTPSTD